ncbi:MAG TPA: S8 family peptidase [Mobilitalea sp.]|nr:S8 family peptidase [Mobilitalea sp.]
MKNAVLRKALTMVVLCGILSSSVNMNAIAESYSSPKQYVVISKSDGNYSVNTYSMTPYEASKMKQLNDDILVVEEDGYVKGSQIQDKESWKEIKTQKNKHDKKVIKKSSKDSKTEWNLQAVKASEVQTQSGQKVKVAIIDSGIDFTTDIDVYLRKNFIPGEDEIPVIYEDITGHGTSVAGIIAAKDNDDGITGINPNVELYSARVLDKNLSAPISRVVEAIYWAIDNKVNIINMSFGTTTDSEALRQAIKDAYNAGILIVAAAGNNGVIEYPAAYDEVIAVGSVDCNGDRCDSSATGEDLELMAPGEQILSTGGFGGVAVTSGTSMASPHVAAIASVLWQKDLNCSSIISFK